MKKTPPTSVRFDLLVCYDVDTREKAGVKRLRRVAKVCVGHGQRVQYSVFECTLTDALFESFQSKLLDIIDHEQDSLRFYRLSGGRESAVQVYGRDTYVDFSDPLIL